MPCAEKSLNPRSWDQIQIDNAFPPINIPIKPLRQLVTVQFRTKRARASGLYVPESAQLDIWHDQIVKIVAMAENIFSLRDQRTGELIPYAEKPWYKVGDYVRVPKHGVDIMYHAPSPEDFENIEAVSKEALESYTGTGLYYVAKEGLYDKGTIKLGNVFFDEINGIIDNPLLILNAH